MELIVQTGPQLCTCHQEGRRPWKPLHSLSANWLFWKLWLTGWHLLWDLRHVLTESSRILLSTAISCGDPGSPDSGRIFFCSCGLKPLFVKWMWIINFVKGRIHRKSQRFCNFVVQQCSHGQKKEADSGNREAQIKGKSCSSAMELWFNVWVPFLHNVCLAGRCIWIVGAVYNNFDHRRLVNVMLNLRAWSPVMQMVQPLAGNPLEVMLSLALHSWRHGCLAAVSASLQFVSWNS